MKNTIVKIIESSARGCAVVFGATLLASMAPAGEVPGKLEYSWIANDYSGKEKFVQHNIEDLCVMPDGTVFTNVFWEEGGGNVQQYQDGKLIRSAGYSRGWGYEGGRAVAANSKYVFIIQNADNEGGGLKGQSWPPKGFYWSGISRRNRADISQPAPFEGGRGGQGRTLKEAFLPIIEAAENRKPRLVLTGVAVSETTLYVSCPSEKVIKVFDAQTMKALPSIAFESAGKLCLDANGDLCVIQTTPQDASLFRISPDGKVIQSRRLPADCIPLDISAGNNGRILVADGGPSQQIRVFDPQLSEAKPIGIPGGIQSGPTPGAIGELRFNKLTGVGVDSSGRLYVASAASGTVLECYSPDLKLLWRQMGLSFVDLVDLDPANEAAIYSRDKLLTMDYTKPAGQQWSYTAYTVNRAKYPDDPRLHHGSHVWLRRVGGRPLLFVTDMTSEFLSVYRFNPETDGYTAIPSALFARRHHEIRDGWLNDQPAKGAWLWTDANANGQMDAGEYVASPLGEGGVSWPDSQGGIWQPTGKEIRYLPFDANAKGGVPAWSVDKARTFPAPPEFTEVRRAHYHPETDQLVLAGNNAKHHNQHWKPMGPVLGVYDSFLTGQPKLRWSITLPYEAGSAGHESREPISFDVAGDYIFVAYTRGMKIDNTTNAYIKVYQVSDGAFVGNMASEKAFGEAGLLDLVESVRAAKRVNGQYVVFLEDDQKAKVITFLWNPAEPAN